jgi:hypothetical protein
VTIAVLMLQHTPAVADGATEAVAPKISSAGEVFIVGNTTFALLHEFGHVVIRDFDVPLLGLEEESADTLAAVALILFDRQQPEAGFGEMLAVTALAQELIWEAGLERNNAATALWAQHDLSAQRFARLACLLYGSDPGRYGWVAQAARMEQIRTETCGEEWRIAERAVAWVRDSYGIPPAERSTRRAAAISVKYAQPLDARETQLAQVLHDRRLLERIAAAVETRFVFPEPLSLKLSRCREPNAYWDDEYREVVLCYELLAALAEMAAKPEVAQAVAAFRSRR